MLIRKSIITSNSHESEAIKATIRETLRLYPIAPFIGRFITNDSIIGNYSIPKEVRHFKRSYYKIKKNRNSRHW